MESLHIMIKKSLSIGASLLLASQIGLADISKNPSDNTQAQEEKLAQLQIVIDQLKQQAKTEHPASTNLGYQAERNAVYVDRDVEHTYLESLSSSTRALSLLQVRNRFGDNSLTLGGEIEMDTQYWFGNNFQESQGEATSDLHNGSGIFLTGADLDLLYNMGQWLQFYTETATYQNGSSIDTSAQSAFVTVGNLDKTPFFATIGKGRPMFGTLPGAPWAASIEQGLFRPSYVNNVTLSYAKDNLITNFTYINPSANHNTFLTDVFYTYDIPKTQLSIGGNLGYINDINGTGMGIASAPNTDIKRTPAVNVEGNLNFGAFSLYSGWESTLAENDALDNNGLSGVWYLQGAYSPLILGDATTFSLAYAQSYNMSNVYFPAASDAGNPISIIGPKRQFYAFVSRNIFTSFILSLEYAWLQTYNNQDNNTITLDTTFYF